MFISAVGPFVNESVLLRDSYPIFLRSYVMS